MASKRMVATSIWTKSRKFRKCSPMERYLFLYLITNEDVELCGAYEKDLDDIAHFTGIENDQLAHLLAKLEERELAFYRDGWVVIPNYEKSQSAENKNVQAGIARSIAALPDEIKTLLVGGKPIHSQEKPMDREEESINNSNSNSNSNGNRNGKSTPPPADTLTPKTSRKPKKTPSEPPDPLTHRAKEFYERMWDGNTLPDYKREWPALKRLASLVRSRSPDDAEAWLDRFLATHERLRQDSESLLHGHPPLPSIAVSGGLLPRILEAMQPPRRTVARTPDPRCSVCGTVLQTADDRGRCTNPDCRTEHERVDGEWIVVDEERRVGE